MAIEDAAALEILLSNMEVTDGVDNRLKLWNQMRLPRCAATQFLSNRMYKDTAERDEGVKQFYAGPLPDANISGWSDPWNDVFYGYNAFEQARKALEYKDAKDGLPDGAVEVLGAYGGEKAKTDIQLKDDSHFFQSGSLHSGQPKTTPGKVNFNSISNTS